MILTLFTISKMPNVDLSTASNSPSAGCSKNVISLLFNPKITRLDSITTLENPPIVFNNSFYTILGEIDFNEVFENLKDTNIQKLEEKLEESFRNLNSSDQKIYQYLLTKDITTQLHLLSLFSYVYFQERSSTGEKELIFNYKNPEEENYFYQKEKELFNFEFWKEFLKENPNFFTFNTVNPFNFKIIFRKIKDAIIKIATSQSQDVSTPS